MLLGEVHEVGKLVCTKSGWSEPKHLIFKAVIENLLILSRWQAENGQK